jgi:hypothetical protein
MFMTGNKDSECAFHEEPYWYTTLASINRARRRQKIAYIWHTCFMLLLVLILLFGFYPGPW